MARIDSNRIQVGTCAEMNEKYQNETFSTPIHYGVISFLIGGLAIGIILLIKSAYAN